jgi:hypothetical protein
MADIIDLFPLLCARRRREKLTDRDIRRAVFRAYNAQLDRATGRSSNATPWTLSRSRHGHGTTKTSGTSGSGHLGLRSRASLPASAICFSDILRRYGHG